MLVALGGEFTLPSPSTLPIRASRLDWGHYLCPSPQQTWSCEWLGTGSH